MAIVFNQNLKNGTEEGDDNSSEHSLKTFTRRSASIEYHCRTREISSPSFGAEWRFQFSCTSGVLGLLLNPNNQLLVKKGVVS